MFAISNHAGHLLGTSIPNTNVDRLYLFSNDTRPMIYMFDNYHKCCNFIKDIKTYDTGNVSNLRFSPSTKLTKDAFHKYSHVVVNSEISKKKQYKDDLNDYNISFFNQSIGDLVHSLVIIQNASMFVAKDYSLNTEKKLLTLQGIYIEPVIDDGLEEDQHIEIVKRFLEEQY